ncbi:hypothetical protein DSO57_1012240 [Entomophthora muscae]|uniref:Uncharacterized protein n=1 Tax=Entomophthora muscae TaxID=34485 RepID=A0ACC2S7Y1_9FUNG|nr:hypothetical protein DSO57_1012240 [Entomophthora muscae]
MAKSLRSKIKQKHKSERRQKIYKPVEDARLMRLASKQAASNCTSLPFSINLTGESSNDVEMEAVDVPEQKTLTPAEKIAKQRQRIAKLHEKIKAKKAAKAEQLQSMDEDAAQDTHRKVKYYKNKPKKTTAKGKLKW